MEAVEQIEKTYDKTTFGFWVYLMTDLIMFAVLFAAYAVLRGSNFGGPTEGELFNLPFAFTETLILLTSSFSCGIGRLLAARNNKNAVLIWLGITFVLGGAFIAMELSEFGKLISEGNSYERSAFLSSFFALIGTHGLHITVGIFWLLILLFQIAKRGLTAGLVRKLTLFSLFWHFLDVVWIFIFTFVYLMGVL